MNKEIRLTDKLKPYCYLILALLSVFMLGAYADATILGTKEIEPQQWFITSSIGLLFLFAFLESYRK